MTRVGTSLIYASLLVAAPLGCVVDKHLGDVDTGTSTEGDDGGTHSDPTVGDDGGASISASSSTPVTTGSGDTAGTTLMDDGASDAPSTTGMPTESCLDWAAPPFECDRPGEATALVTGDSLPALDEAPCDVIGVESLSPTADLVTLDCGDLHELEISSDAPHLELPFAVGEDVIVSATDSPKVVIDETVPSFVIRSPAGQTLMVWVNEIGPGFDVPLDLVPIAVTVTGSGCGTFFWNELCDDDQSAIALQRSILQFGNKESPTLLFDGNQAVVSAGAEDFSVIAESVERIVCWDEACGGDDSGPFDRTTFLAVALPGA